MTQSILGVKIAMINRLLKNPENDRREFVGFILYCGERPKGARRNIEKSGGVVEDRDVGFLLY